MPSLKQHKPSTTIDDEKDKLCESQSKETSTTFKFKNFFRVLNAIDYKNIREERKVQTPYLASFTALGFAIFCALLMAIFYFNFGLISSVFSIGTAFIIGVSIRATGKSRERIFGKVSAAFTFFSFLIGHFFIVIHEAAKQESIGYIDTILLISMETITKYTSFTYRLMDFVFYFIALFIAYNLAFRKEKH